MSDAVQELVTIVRNPTARYCEEPPFHPAVAYPEYPFSPDRLSKQNDAYELVRNALKLANLDSQNFGTSHWNPLGEIVKPGNRVVLKPNLVYHRNKSGADLDAVITHASVIRAIADYAYIALAGRGELIIADAPQADCDLSQQLKLTKLLSITDFYNQHAQIKLSFYDLRKLLHVVNEEGFLDSRSREELAGDPRGYRIVDLGSDSELAALGTFDRVYGADYYRAATVEHHGPHKNEYCISGTILNAHVVISVPKMKLHYKVGVTLNLKNLVGINGDKNYLPHYRVGSPAQGGDEFPDAILSHEKMILNLHQQFVDRFLVRNTSFGDWVYTSALKGYRELGKRFGFKVRKEVPRSGDWWGNDTAWRMAVDLNRILFYANSEGKMQDSPQRRYFSIVDGIVGGEGRGPLAPDPHHSGVIVCGCNPVVVDHVTAVLMGMDPAKIRIISNAAGQHKWPLWLGSIERVRITSNKDDYSGLLGNPSANLGFVSPPSWKGHIEWIPSHVQQ